MLLMIFLGSVVAAVAVVAYSYQVLLGSWGRAHKRVLYAPPPLPPPPPTVSAMLAAVSLPEAPVKIPTGTAPQPIASAPLPERFMPPLAAHAKPVSPPPRRPARGSMPPPLPPRPTRQRAAVTNDFIDEETNVELSARDHS